MAHGVSFDWFESRAERIPEMGCWIWMGSLNDRGYGRHRLGGRGSAWKLMHRLSWEMYRGQVPIGMLVLHRCDIPSCVNPGHLFIGTQKDNMQDASRKGRLYRGTKVT